MPFGVPALCWHGSYLLTNIIYSMSKFRWEIFKFETTMQRAAAKDTGQGNSLESNHPLIVLFLEKEQGSWRHERSCPKSSGLNTKGKPI